MVIERQREAKVVKSKESKSGKYNKGGKGGDNRLEVRSHLSHILNFSNCSMMSTKHYLINSIVIDCSDLPQNWRHELSNEKH
jgi:hypothetical protein